jgi:hypothetical protein
MAKDFFWRAFSVGKTAQVPMSMGAALDIPRVKGPSERQTALVYKHILGRHVDQIVTIFAWRV